MRGAGFDIASLLCPDRVIGGAMKSVDIDECRPELDGDGLDCRPDFFLGGVVVSKYLIAYANFRYRNFTIRGGAVTIKRYAICPHSRDTSTNSNVTPTAICAGFPIIDALSSKLNTLIDQ